METLNLKSCRQLLADELSDRKSKNSFYSLRAFARDLKIGSTSLSDVLGGKRNLSKTNIEKVSEKLMLSPEHRKFLIGELYKGEPSSISTEQERRDLLEEDSFKLISNWYYLAILNLANIKGNSSSPVWIGERLGISTIEASTAIERLCRLGLLSIKNDKLIRTGRPIVTTHDIPSAAIRKAQHQLLDMAKISLDSDSVERREFEFEVMAINPKKINKAKNLVNEFLDKISDCLEKGPRSEVYALGFQLFPLSKEEQDR
jgi:hypothetical protein